MRKLGSDGKEQRSANFYKAPYVTAAQFAALTPADGDECYFIADATNGVIWHFRYNAGSGSAYKWEFLGGPPVLTQGTGTVITANSTWQTIFSITMARGGEYIAQGGWWISTSAAQLHGVGVSVAGAGPGLGFYGGPASSAVDSAVTVPPTFLAAGAGQTITLMGIVASAYGNGNSGLVVIPRRIS